MTLRHVTKKPRGKKAKFALKPHYRTRKRRKGQQPETNYGHYKQK